MRKQSLWLLTLMTVALVTTSASAQLPVSVKLGVVAGLQQAEITSTVLGVDLDAESTTLNTFGAEVAVGIPMGFVVGGFYLRHTGDLRAGTDATNLAWGLGANELGLFAEKHISLLPMSPAAPYLGGGLSLSNLSLGEDVGDETLDASSQIYRLYGLAGVKLIAVVVQVRAGWSFGSFDGSDLGVSDIPGLDEAEVSYDGFFASAGLSLSLF